MVLSAQTIRQFSVSGNGLVSPLNESSKDGFGNSIGLSACGVDITLAEQITLYNGCFVLASALERFNLPDNIVGVVHDKSSLARRGLLVQNTVLEPGWRGYLTLEITYHNLELLKMEPGWAIAQVIFHQLDRPTEIPYNGKYQDQNQGPQRAR